MFKIGFKVLTHTFKRQILKELLVLPHLKNDNIPHNLFTGVVAQCSIIIGVSSPFTAKTHHFV